MNDTQRHLEQENALKRKPFIKLKRGIYYDVPIFPYNPL